MPAAVTSFWKSTNCFGARLGGLTCGATNSGIGSALVAFAPPVSGTRASSTSEPRGAFAARPSAAAGASSRLSPTPPEADPVTAAASRPAASPSARHSASRWRPRTLPPSKRGSGPGAGGTKPSAASSQTGRPPVWQARCTAGLQPPDEAIVSHSRSRVSPVTKRARASTGATIAPRTRFDPSASMTTEPVMTGMPASSVSSMTLASGRFLASTTAATLRPARAHARAAR